MYTGPSRENVDTIPTIIGIIQTFDTNLSLVIGLGVMTRFLDPPALPPPPPPPPPPQLPTLPPAPTPAPTPAPRVPDPLEDFSNFVAACNKVYPDQGNSITSLWEYMMELRHLSFVIVLMMKNFKRLPTMISISNCNIEKCD